MHERILFRLCASISLAVALPACLDRNGGGFDTTVVDLTSGTTGITGLVETSTTFPEIMSTTVDPADTDSTGASGDATTDEPIPPGCGNGVLDPDEECDQGPANADDAACTSACKHAFCGDGLVRADVEACDDGSANGDYGHCAHNCKGPGPRCGDGVLQKNDGELCDQLEPDSGCLKNCTWPTSCLEIKESWGDEATDGLYVVHRMSQWLTVWCAMSADGGGYTVLKHAATEGNLFTAQQAENICQNQYGMSLMVPRSSAHRDALAVVAGDPTLGPANSFEDKLLAGDAHAYLRIFGITPVDSSKSCTGKPLNSSDCPQWTAWDGGPYFVSGTALDPNQPSTPNCKNCSMEYFWDLNAPPNLIGYAAFSNGGVGATSTHFLCEIGDKLP